MFAFAMFAPSDVGPGFAASAPSSAPLVSAEDRALLDKVKAREKQRTELQRNPRAYITPGTWTNYDRGILNSYTHVQAITFTNGSEFDVYDIAGHLVRRSTSISPVS